MSTQSTFHLGETLSIQWHDGQKYLGKNKKFKLSNNLELTYGQINALGGDYYGSDQPICKGSNANERRDRFMAGWTTLAVDKRAKPEAEELIRIKKKEVELLEKAKYNNGGDNPVHGSTMDDLKAFYQAFGREGKGYAGLAMINFDHFGNNARIAYNAGHEAAWTLL